MGKKALVISGGGSKGAFAVGVVKSILQHFPTIDFDIFVGTSTGSLIVPFVSIGRIDLLEKMYTTINTPDIVLGGNLAARFVGSVSLFDATPLSNLIKKYYDDVEAQKILDTNKEVYVTTTCLQTSESVIFTNKAPIANSDYHFEKFTSKTTFRRAILASACQPVFMQPVAIDPTATPIRQYVDGGLKEYIGIQIAVDAGAEEIIAISLAGTNAGETKQYTAAVDILFKTIDIFTANVGVNNFKLPAVYNSALQYIAAVKQKMVDDGVAQSTIDNYFNVPLSQQFVGKKPLRIHHIYPIAPLGGGAGGLTFDPTEMKAMVAKGETRLSDYVASLPPGESFFV